MSIRAVAIVTEDTEAFGPLVIAKPAVEAIPTLAHNGAVFVAAYGSEAPSVNMVNGKKLMMRFTAAGTHTAVCCESLEFQSLTVGTGACTHLRLVSTVVAPLGFSVSLGMILAPLRVVRSATRFAVAIAVETLWWIRAVASRATREPSLCRHMAKLQQRLEWC